MSKKSKSLPPAQVEQPEPQPKVQEGKLDPNALVMDVTNVLKQINPVSLNCFVDNAQMIGDPIFTKHDLYTTYQPLARIMRLIFIEDRITKAKFDALHRQKLQESFMPTNQISYSKNNMIRTLTQPDITWNFFDKVMPVIGYNIIDVAITIQREDTKEVRTVSTSDVARIIKDSAYSPTLNVVRTDHVEE